MNVPLSAQQVPRLAKYELLDELGHGGMATVFRARDLRLDREVAIKVIHKHLRENPEVSRRFAAEAKAVAKLRHPCIVEVYDVSEEDEVEKYLVVELLRGTTLRKLLAEHGPFPPEVAAGIGIDLGSALAHAHAAGVIHRDVKPENVLIEVGAEPDGQVRVKLTDFGIAKILDAQGVTSTGQVLGSPAHMAPEQIEGGEIDARADVFALGVLLYECMVGHLPFEGNNPAQVLRRVLEGTYAPADRENPLVGGRWARMLARVLAKDPADRCQADAFVHAMKAELASLQIPDHSTEPRSFFANPELYREQLPGRIVPVLVNRGETGRRAGDVVGAASDFSRALAYAPRDPEIPKLMLRLRRGTMRRRACLLGSMFAVAVAGIGLTAYATWHVLDEKRIGPAAPTSNPPLSELPGLKASVFGSEVAGSAGRLPVATGPRPAASEANTGLAIRPSTSPGASASAPPPAITAAREHPRREIAPAPPAAPQYRDVKVLVNPKGARVSIDDGPFEDLSFGKIKRLAAGTHLFRASVPNSPCCEPLSKQLDIRPDDGSNVPQEIPLSLRFHEASLSSPSAPPNAVLRCPLLRVSGPANSVYRVPMTTLDLDVPSCELELSGTTRRVSSVTLRAGVFTPVPWPTP